MTQDTSPFIKDEQVETSGTRTRSRVAQCNCAVTIKRLEEDLEIAQEALENTKTELDSKDEKLLGANSAIESLRKGLKDKQHTLRDIKRKRTVERRDLDTEKRLRKEFAKENDDLKNEVQSLQRAMRRGNSVPSTYTQSATPPSTGISETRQATSTPMAGDKLLEIENQKLKSKVTLKERLEEKVTSLEAELSQANEKVADLQNRNEKLQGWHEEARALFERRTSVN